MYTTSHINCIHLFSNIRGQFISPNRYIHGDKKRRVEILSVFSRRVSKKSGSWTRKLIGVRWYDPGMTHGVCRRAQSRGSKSTMIWGWLWYANGRSVERQRGRGVWGHPNEYLSVPLGDGVKYIAIYRYSAGRRLNV